MTEQNTEVKKSKSKREIRREQRIERHVEALRESEAKIGQLIPVIEDQFGVVSGNKRLAANPEWRRKKIIMDDEYEHWKSVANSNVQFEPSKEEWMTWVNNAIQALIKEKKMSNSDIVKKLVNEFGLPRTRIYELIPDDYKREYNKLKADGNFEENDESRKSESGQLSKEDVKVLKGMTELELEKHLISELEKQGVKPEVKVPFDRPYNYPRPYFGDIKVGNVIMDIAGKSGVEEVEERDKYFMEKGLLPIHFPGPMIRKYAPEVASLVKTFMSFVSKYKVKS